MTAYERCRSTLEVRLVQLALENPHTVPTTTINKAILPSAASGRVNTGNEPSTRQSLTWNCRQVTASAIISKHLLLRKTTEIMGSYLMAFDLAIYLVPALLRLASKWKWKRADACIDLWPLCLGFLVPAEADLSSLACTLLYWATDHLAVERILWKPFRFLDYRRKSVL